jgi:hypothetical protein
MALADFPKGRQVCGVCGGGGQAVGQTGYSECPALPENSASVLTSWRRQVILFQWPHQGCCEKMEEVGTRNEGVPLREGPT